MLISCLPADDLLTAAGIFTSMLMMFIMPIITLIKFSKEIRRTKAAEKAQENA